MQKGAPSTPPIASTCRKRKYEQLGNLLPLRSPRCSEFPVGRVGAAKKLSTKRETPYSHVVKGGAFSAVLALPGSYCKKRGREDVSSGSPIRSSRQPNQQWCWPCKTAADEYRLAATPALSPSDEFSFRGMQKSSTTLSCTHTHTATIYEIPIKPRCLSSSLESIAHTTILRQIEHGRD